MSLQNDICFIVYKYSEKGTISCVNVVLILIFIKFLQLPIRKVSHGVPLLYKKIIDVYLFLKTINYFYKII